MDGRRTIGLGSALVAVALLALALGAYRFHHDRALWTPDGAIYLRLTLQARGAPPDEAQREADVFMRTTPEAGNPESRGFYTGAPPAFYRDQFALFRTRPLYPLLASALYPRFGPDSLKVVSTAAYVVAVVFAFLLLLQLGRTWLAALGAAALATSPAVLAVAAMPLTDELALGLWIGALGALLAYLRTRSVVWLVVLVAATAALTFVRPAIYLPLGAAIGAFLGAARGSPERVAATRAVAGIVAVGAVYFAYTAVVHGPGIAEQLRWQYEWQRTIGGPFAAHGFAAWWAASFPTALAKSLVVDIYRNNALFVIALALFGAATARRTIVVPVAIGGAVATLAALAANPLEVQRTVTLPLTPLVILLATIALTALADRTRESRAARTP